MKNIYSLFTLFLVFMALSVAGQSLIYAPELRAPEDGDDEQNPNVVLDWDAVTGQDAITYEAEIATQEDFSNAVTYPRTDLSAQPTENLLFGQTYYWRVRAFDGAEASEWSESWSFIVVETVSIKKPGAGAEVYANPLIEWDEITGLLKYQLDFDTSYVWNPGNTGGDEDINGTFLIDATNMWVVGTGGLVQQYNGSEWTTMDAGTTDDLNALSFVDATNGYVVGEGGLVLHYDGTSWTLMDAGVTVDLTGVSFTDADNGWAVGEDGTIVRYNAGTWTEETTPGTDDLFGVYALATDNVWACGKGGALYSFNGTDWSESAAGSSDLFSVWFTDAGNGWVSGKSGTIFYYDGSAWTEQMTGVTRDLLGISMSGSGGYAVGKNGSMVMYDGSAWMEVTSSLADDIHGIHLVGDLGLIGGEDAYVSIKYGEASPSPFYQVIDIEYDSLQYQSANLPFGSFIFFRMRAIHSTDTSAWSLASTMQTYASPKLDRPKDTTPDQQLTTLFKWRRYEGASEYYFRIDDNPEFSSPSEFLMDSLSVNYTMLKFGHKYYWQVRASHVKDISDWSDPWWLSTIDHVELMSPDDGEIDVANCPAYSWEEIEGSKEYEIEVADNDAFMNSMSATSETPNYQCQNPMERNTIYYWRVRAITAQDSSSWSETWSFKTEGFIGIDEINESDISIYPNPNNGQFNVNISSGTQELYIIKVTDLTGRLVYSEEVQCQSGPNNKTINLNNNNKGLYLISIQKGDAMITKKLFVE